MKYSRPLSVIVFSVFSKTAGSFSCKLTPLSSQTVVSSIFLYFSVTVISVACEQQTYFRSLLLFLRGGREATTGNTSAVRRL